MLQNLLLLFCFFLSGAAGLVYETVWMKQASYVFGNTVTANLPGKTPQHPPLAEPEVALERLMEALRKGVFRRAAARGGNLFDSQTEISIYGIQANSAKPENLRKHFHDMIASHLDPPAPDPGAVTASRRGLTQRWLKAGICRKVRAAGQPGMSSSSATLATMPFASTWNSVEPMRMVPTGMSTFERRTASTTSIGERLVGIAHAFRVLERKKDLRSD